MASHPPTSRPPTHSRAGRASRWRQISSFALLLAWAAGAAPLLAQETADYFRQNCVSCHTIGGGRLVGPDLKNATERQNRDWLVGFVFDPKGVLDGGDPYALKLREEAGGALMPPIAGMTRAQAEALISLIEAESGLPESEFAGLDISDEPFSSADILRGRQLFQGYQHLANGGPACISCHTTGSLGALGGGRLGPDLTRVVERLKGRKSLASWLLAPATEVMRPVYAKNRLTNEEILPLVAFLEAEVHGGSEGRGSEDPGTSQITFLLLGLAGTALAFVLADGIWRRRFRAVRRPLVKGEF